MVRRNAILLVAFVLLSAAAVAMFVMRRRPYEHQPFVLDSAAASAFREASAAPSSSGPRVWPTPFSVKLRELPSKNDLPPGTLRILVIGDSVAKFLGLAMRYRQDERNTFVAERGVGNCSIFEPEPYEDENGTQVMSSSCSMEWAADVAELRPDITFIVMGGGYFAGDACTTNFALKYDKRVFKLARMMGTAAGQIILARVPYPVKGWRHSNVPERVDCFNKMLVNIAQKYAFPMVDVMSHVCPTRECNMESDGKPIRPDGLHFDGGGAEETARWVLDELKRLHKPATENQ